MTACLIRLLPPSIRDRYGGEIEELLRLSEHPLRDRWDVLLLIARLSLESAMYRLMRPSTPEEARLAYRFALAVALFASLSLVWGNLAMGILGSEDERANMMYIGVLAVGVLGALVARFQPSGMSRASLAMALAQAAIVVIALAAGMHEYPGSSVLEILWLNGAFIALFVGAALLFRYAARGNSPSGARREA